MSSQATATKVVKKLTDAGHTAYFAGGWVRDLLLGTPCDDIDIATSAHPEEIEALFSKTIAVGAAFGVIIVLLDTFQFEVASFRSDGQYLSGRKPETIHYSSPKEDAQRRDFTINGMFYDPLKAYIHDLVGGQEDIKKHLIRTIGNPQDRFEEDRLRMIRAVRFAIRLNMKIEESTEKAIIACAHRLLPAVSMERIWQELQKIIKDGHFYKAVAMLWRFGLLQNIFPSFKNTSESTLNQLIKTIQRLPKSSPPITYITALFPQFDKKNMDKLCRYLKMSNKDRFLAEFLVESQTLIDSKEEREKADWARFYAFPNNQLCINASLAKTSITESSNLIKTHENRKKELQPHIDRLRRRRLILNASDLKKMGIESSPIMGELIREADRIAINENILKTEDLLKRIQKSPLWPKGASECSQ